MEQKNIVGKRDIRLDLIDNFHNHPYHVFNDADMVALVESIKTNGLLNPIIVRSKVDGRYELISGHRRKRAYEILGLEKIKAVIAEVDDNEAVILMVDSNCQRSKILPSEKAFSYKMKLDAIKSQGKRTDLTCAQVEHKSKKSREVLAEQMGESAAQVARYICLTNLVLELLEFVDSGRMKMQPAIELSYIMQPNFWLSCLLINEDAMCKQLRTDSTATYESESGKSCPTEILEALEKHNAEGRPIWKPMHAQPIYSSYPFVSANEKDIGIDIFSRGLCLPSDIKMTEKEQDNIIDIHRQYQ